MPTRKRTINTRFFTRLLEDRKMRQRELADQIPMDQPALSRTLRGLRTMQLPEAARIAVLLGVPLEDVLANAGVHVPETAEKAGKVAVVGTIDAHLNVRIGRPRGAQTAPAPVSGAAWAGMQALRYSTAGTPLDAYDVVLAYYSPVEGVPADAIGRWCVVTDTEGRVRLRVVRHGHRRGAFNLSTMLVEGETTEEGVWLASASPVAWLKFV